MATKTAGTDMGAIRHDTAARAYTIWETEGRPHGRDVQHWEQAEAEILGGGRTRRTTSKTTAKVPPKVAAAMTAAAGETPRRATRATSKTTKKATTTGTRKKR